MKDFAPNAGALDEEAPRQQQPPPPDDLLTITARRYLASVRAIRDLWPKIERDRLVVGDPPGRNPREVELEIFDRHGHDQAYQERGAAQREFLPELWDAGKQAVVVDGAIVGAHLVDEHNPDELAPFAIPADRVHHADRPGPGSERRTALLVEESDLEADPSPRGQTYAQPARRYLAAVYAWRAYWRAETAHDEDVKRRTGEYPTKEEEAAYRERHGHDVIQAEFFDSEAALMAALKEHHARGVEVGGKLIFLVDPAQEGGSHSEGEEFQIVSAGDIVQVS